MEKMGREEKNEGLERNGGGQQGNDKEGEWDKMEPKGRAGSVEEKRGKLLPSLGNEAKLTKRGRNAPQQ